MGLVTVHNITDRPTTPGEGRAFMVGNQKLRPGKFVEIDEAAINQKLRQLHGTSLWFGDLPNRLARNSQSGQQVQERAALRRVSVEDPMTYEQAYARLAAESEATLQEYCQSMSPQLTFQTVPPQLILVKRVARALFTSGRVLDPQVFFWLRRWTREGDTFIEKE